MPAATPSADAGNGRSPAARLDDALAAVRTALAANDVAAAGRALDALQASAEAVAQRVAELEYRDDVRGRMLPALVHDVRNPLHVVSLAIGGLTSPRGESFRAELLEHLRTSADNMQQMLRDFLVLDQLSAGAVRIHTDPVPTGELLGHAVALAQPLAQRAKLRVEATSADGLPAVAADTDRIERVFAALIANALRYSPPDGVVRLSAGRSPTGVRFAVRDEGSGVEPQDQLRIFHRFTPGVGTAPSGCGVGLAIAREIVEAHGGTIGVDSVPGRGATFWFDLPLAS